MTPAALPVIPLPGGRQNLFTLRAEDLGPAFLRLLEARRLDLVNLAHPEPVSFASMMRSFARRQGNNAVFLPLSWRLLWIPLRLGEVARLKLKFRSDSLVSLMNQNPAPDFSRLRDLDIRLRAFDDQG